MQITGIVCEYNPLHSGHKKQIDYLKGLGHMVVCLMSGNFVQRGSPAIFDKMTRAKAALSCGADLVLELPVQYALSSAEGFATGAVHILSMLCNNICFGAETADVDALMDMAKLLRSDDFSRQLRVQLDKGLSFPAARQAAVSAMGGNADLLQTPNNILAVEYCKAILAQNSQLTPLVLHRQGSYHACVPEKENPSATALRNLMTEGCDWRPFVPRELISLYEDARLHTLQQGEAAILYRLRTMHDDQFEALPYGSEGLWRKLMHASRSCASLEDVIDATKSKRYTRSRIDRMILCAFLGLEQAILSEPAPYCRVLGFTDTGRQVLHHVKDSRYFINIGQHTGSNYESLEHRCGSLYGLFACSPENPAAESELRIHYHK